MSNANKRQVGGGHYKDQLKKQKLQHWDVAADHEYDYFQGQITKYVDRWKYKWPTKTEKIKDLEKGLHFYEKYMEEVKAGKFMPDDTP